MLSQPEGAELSQAERELNSVTQSVELGQAERAELAVRVFHAALPIQPGMQQGLTAMTFYCYLISADASQTKVYTTVFIYPW